MIIADEFKPGTFVDALEFIGHHWRYLASLTLSHLEISLVALGFALLIALPTGILLGHLHRGGNVVIGISIIGRALPIIALIAIFVTIIGIGFTNNMTALAILATGPILTAAYDGVDTVDDDVVEAARGMGMSGRQVLWRVELPLAIPILFVGIRVAAVTVVATAIVASAAAGRTLGDVIYNQASYRLAGVVGASLCAMALSVAVFLLLALVQRLVTPAGLKAARNYGEV